jgi:hypothetical protein
MATAVASRDALARATQLIPALVSSMHKGQAGRIGVVGGCAEYGHCLRGSSCCCKLIQGIPTLADTLGHRTMRPSRVFAVYVGCFGQPA